MDQGLQLPEEYIETYQGAGYPPAPWVLRGTLVGVTGLVSLCAARLWLPPEAHLISVMPGKTLGGFVLAAYNITRHCHTMS